jgi:hypothetical protein
MVWVGGQLLLSLLVLPVLRQRLAAHRGLTLSDLAEPGPGRTLGEKITLFAAVLLLSGVHGVAVGRGQDPLARLLAIATLLGSVGVVLLATALVP